MKNILSICFFTLIVQVAKSQDIIIMKTGDEVKAKVTEVTPAEIKYKKEDNPEGPVFTAPKSDVFMIKYSNGTKDVFSNEKAAPSTTATTASTNKTAKKTSGVRYANITQVGYAPGVGGVDYSFPYYNQYGGFSNQTIHIDNTLKIVRLTTVNAVQLNNYFSAGIGLGFHYYYDQGEHAITLPVFLDLRGTILGTQNISPVIFFDVGPSVKIEDADELDGIILEPGVGINIPANGTGINFSFSYMMQKIRNTGYDYYSGQVTNSSLTLKFLSFKAGFSF